MSETDIGISLVEFLSVSLAAAAQRFPGDGSPNTHSRVFTVVVSVT